MTMQNETNAKPTGTSWQNAAAASAAAQAPGDPPPKRFTERLPCVLTNEERIKVAIRMADARQRFDAWNAETKQIMTDRKSRSKKLEAIAKEYEDATRTGRVQRDVMCEERVSFQQNRKWRVRLDTNELVDEQALSVEERQASLPLGERDDDEGDDDDDVDAQGSLDLEKRDDLGPVIDDDGEPKHDFGDVGDETDQGHASVDDGTEITNPGAVVGGDLDAISAPKKKRAKKSVKAKGASKKAKKR